MGVVGLGPTGFRKVKVLDFAVTAMFPPNVEAIGGSARECCGDDLQEGSAGILRLIMKEWMRLHGPWLEVS